MEGNVDNVDQKAISRSLKADDFSNGNVMGR